MSRCRMGAALAGLAVMAALVSACADRDAKDEPAADLASPDDPPTEEPVEATPPEPPSPPEAAEELPEGVRQPPEWLGQRPLPERSDGFGEPQSTPDELVDRRLATQPLEHLPPPDGTGFVADIQPVPAEVAERSTWHSGCPVDVEDLRYVTMTFWGFDERPHTGEMLLHRRAAEDIVGIFERLYSERFPIEEMRVVEEPELDLPPTGDGNNTTAFVCREKTSDADSWSEHAAGLAVDINPFHNPYRRGDLVVPELAGAYADRDDHRPGMIQPGDVVTQAFADIGWGWGGNWSSAVDWMHFSASGR